LRGLSAARRGQEEVEREAGAEAALVARFPEGSAMRVYWAATLAEVRPAAPLARLYDMSRHTGRR
jgi:hypothetical protein